MRTLLLVLCSILTVSAVAQGGSPTVNAAPGLNVNALPKGSTQLFTVKPDGKLEQAPDNIKLQLRSELLTHPTRVSEVLEKNGLVDDHKTVEMLRKLNPHQDFSTDTIPAGTKIDIYAPEPNNTTDPTGKAKTPITFDTDNAGAIALKTYSTQARDIKITAQALPKSAFIKTKDFDTYQRATEDIVFTANTLESQANDLSPSDIATVQYEVLYASRKAEEINQAGAAEGIKTQDIEDVDAAAASAKMMAERIKQGKPPTPTRTVTVNTLQENSEEAVKGLQVYVLPTKFFTEPWLFSEDEIKNFLTRFSFSQETSPSSHDLNAFSAQVWVGKKFKFPEMARLVKDQHVSNSQPINDPENTTPLSLIFRIPKDITEP